MRKCDSCKGTKKISPLGCIVIDCKQCNASGYIIEQVVAKQDLIHGFVATRDTGEVIIDNEPKPVGKNRFKRKVIKRQYNRKPVLQVAASE